MHDPMTVAFEIKYPWKTQGYRASLITIWHVDPERDGTDDSCGWFMRSRHGDQKVLERIIRRYETEWDSVFDPNDRSDDYDDEPRQGRRSVYFRGLFKPDGQPHFSVAGIVLNLFFVAASEHFDSNGHTNWKRAKKFLNENLLDILLFAENTTDSLFDGITRKFEIGCGEEQSKQSRDERIRNMASSVYAWILRAERPWWKAPRWHFWHWKIQVHPLQSLKRWLFSKCCKCGKGFRYGESPVSGNWDSTGPRWFRSEQDVYHGDCSGVTIAATAKHQPGVIEDH